MANLELTEKVTGRRANVTVRGDIDLATSPEFRRYLDELCAGDLDLIVIDFSGCDFMDSTGLRALAHACPPMRQPPPRVRIGRVSEAVARVLDVSGLASIFDYADADDCPVCGVITPEGQTCTNCGSRVG